MLFNYSPRVGIVMGMIRRQHEENRHIPISFACYLVCLLLPGYYIGEQFEPQMSIPALVWGWLGPLDGHFAWFANPLFFLALIYSNRPRRSSVFGFIGLALALSFLFYKRIVVSEAPTYASIVAYGWGYGLWVASLAVLATGQLVRDLTAEARRALMASVGAGAAVLLIYSIYYIIGSDSPRVIRAERNREFESRCAAAGEHIAKTADGAKGIFFDPDWDVHIAPFTPETPNIKQIRDVGILGTGLLNSGMLAFYEARDPADKSRYVRYVLGDPGGRHVGELGSEYAVLRQPYPFPRRVNLSGATITIKDRRDDSVMASVTYVLDNENGRFCGPSSPDFSTTELVIKVLGLKVEHPSAYR
jgi:hypothetical protein